MDCRHRRHLSLNAIAILLAGWFALISFAARAQNGSNEEGYLDVSINLFTHSMEAVAAPYSSPDLRQAESRYMAVLLGLRLTASGKWGAVRITPVNDPTAELSISGEIIHSDQQKLSVYIRATDSSGRLWIDKLYESQVSSGVSLMDSPLTQDPFQSLYSRILADLAVELTTRSPADISNLKQLSLLRYGAGLSPETFASFVGQNEEGFYTLLRLPANNDPMLRRLTSIRDREYLFIDVVNEQFQQFYLDIKPLYDMWRSTQVEQQAHASNYTTTQLNDDDDFSPGSYYALREQYERFRYAKIEQKYQEELAVGFANELKPTRIELDESLVNLQGTLEQQYAEWRSILKELFELETAGG